MIYINAGIVKLFYIGSSRQCVLVQAARTAELTYQMKGNDRLVGQSNHHKWLASRKISVKTVLMPERLETLTSHIGSPRLRERPVWKEKALDCDLP